MAFIVHTGIFEWNVPDIQSTEWDWSEKLWPHFEKCHECEPSKDGKQITGIY